MHISVNSCIFLLFSHFLSIFSLAVSAAIRLIDSVLSNIDEMKNLRAQSIPSIATSLPRRRYESKDGKKHDKQASQ